MNNLMKNVIVILLVVEFAWLLKIEMKIARFEFRILMLEKLHGKELLEQVDSIITQINKGTIK